MGAEKVIIKRTDRKELKWFGRLVRILEVRKMNNLTPPGNRRRGRLRNCTSPETQRKGTRCRLPGCMPGDGQVANSCITPDIFEVCHVF
jgi:hypothetical protein